MWNTCYANRDGIDQTDYPAMSAKNTSIMGDYEIIAECFGSKQQQNANAAYILRACNNHEQLLEACKLALTRNQYGNIENALKTAIRKAEGGE